MTREEALAILKLPQAQAEAALLKLWEKAEQWERLQTQSPTPSSGDDAGILEASRA